MDIAVVASPDFGGLKKARVFANQLNLDLVNVDKTRNLKTGKVTAHSLHGDVKGKEVLIFDDAILSGGTVVEVSKLLKTQGAVSIVFLATHGLLVDNSIDELQNSAVDKVVITNTIEQKKLPSKFEVLDVAPIFAQELKKLI